MVPRLLTVALFAIATLSTSDALPQESVAQQEELSTRHAKLEKEASRIRGLQFKGKVDYQVVDRAGTQALLEQRLNEEMPPQKFQNVSAAYAKLGLIPHGMDLRETILALYGEQIAAFYDQKNRKLYTITDLPFSDNLQNVLMVHELTHALQDQNFDLGTLPLELKTNDDVALAALSLVEGDATLVFSRYASESAKLGLKDILSTMTVGQQSLYQAPRVLRKTLLFPYMQGTKFVTRLFADGGWDRINRAYKDLPQSTEQILHPEKYLDQRDDPIPISLPDFSSVAGKKWDLLEENVLGELNTHILFTEFLGSIRAMRPSRGWGGDRFAAYRIHDGEPMLLVWATAWDTEKDRQEFVSSYRTLLEKKHQEQEFSTLETSDYLSLTSPDLVIWLGWWGKYAVVLEAPDSSTLTAMLWELVKAGGDLAGSTLPSPPHTAEN